MDGGCLKGGCMAVVVGKLMVVVGLVVHGDGIVGIMVVGWWLWLSWFRG